MTGRILLAAGAMLLAVAGCDNAGRGEDVAWEGNQFVDSLPPPGDTTDAALTVMLTEWNVRLAADTIYVGEGPVRIRARNMGGYPHSVALEGPGGGPWESAVVGPDQWVTLEADLEPGTWTVYCPVDDEHGNHRAEGMEAYLVVRSEREREEEGR